MPRNLSPKFWLLACFGPPQVGSGVEVSESHLEYVQSMFERA